ncbi:DUF1858 domain-containing protein [Enterococcus faecalis]
MKKIYLSQTIYEIVMLYPEVQAILYELGFKNIKQPAMLQSAGRYMTIPKGAKMKKIPEATIKQAFEAAGYILEGDFNGK